MTRQQALETALNALSSFYEEGDDGDAVRMALDAIGSALGFSGERSLLDANLEKGLKRDIERLYELAEAGEYGAGLTRDDANGINAIVDEVSERLQGHLNNARSKSQERMPSRKRG